MGYWLSASEDKELQRALHPCIATDDNRLGIAMYSRVWAWQCLAMANQGRAQHTAYDA
jgi:hypothetical protein